MNPFEQDGCNMTILLHREILKMAGVSKFFPRVFPCFHPVKYFSSQILHAFLETLCLSNFDQLDDWQLLWQLLSPWCTILHSIRAKPLDRPQLIDAIRH
jgi:hypothetical protein